MRRVAVTGMGVVSPSGVGVTAFFDNISAGRSAIRALDATQYARFPHAIAAQLDFDGSAHFPPIKYRMLDRCSQFALVAAAEAIQDARLDFNAVDKSRCGVSFGVAIGGTSTTDEFCKSFYGDGSDRVAPYTVLMAMTNAAASWIGIDYGLSGSNLTYATACSSSSVAIGEAWKRIGAGEADVMVVGGAECPLTVTMMRAWEALRTLAPADAQDPATSCKPFAKNRGGLVLGEGAAVLILEEWEHAVARGATIHAELVGYGLFTDCSHITKPSVEGQARAMQAALDAAALPADAITYINAHGTGTQANDVVETNAIKSVFGSHAAQLAVSSTKSMHGHLLGGAGSLEMVASIMAMKQAVLPPTMHLIEPDPECDLDYVPNAARSVTRVEAVMSNSFAFGGTNAVLIAKNVT